MLGNLDRAPAHVISRSADPKIARATDDGASVDS
jgi:hypothetical protein